jgi:hypothetical protein
VLSYVKLDFIEDEYGRKLELPLFVERVLGYMTLRNQALLWISIAENLS